VPLGSGDIIQTAKGSLASTQPTLPVATTAGNTVIIVVFSEDISAVAGFDMDYALPLNTSPNLTYLRVFRQADTAGGETAWTVIGGATVGAWVVYEVSGLYPGPDVFTFNAGTRATGETLNSNTLGLSDADVFCLSVWAAHDGSGTTAPTWASYTNSYTERQEQAVTGSAGNSLDLAVADKFPGSVVDQGSTATVTVSGGHTADVGVIILAYRSVADPLVFLTGFGPGTAVSATVGTTPYIPLIVGTPAVVADATSASGYAAELVATAATEGLGLSAVFLAVTTVHVGSFRVKFPGSLPGGDVDLFTLQTDGANNWAIRFRASDTSLVAGIANGGGSPVAGPVVVADTWYLVELYLDTQGFLLHWRVNTVAQADYALPTGGLVVNAYLGWGVNAATATVRYTDWCASVTPADYPLGDVRIVTLAVDPAGTVTLTGTTGNWLTFTANGTTAAWNATTARNNIDEIPFTIGAANDGIVQATASTTDHVDVPLTSYTLQPGEIVMGARVVVLGWAVSGTAATFGFRYFNGTTEELLVAGTVNPAFSNSTTAPGWFGKMLTLANINTQAKLDASVIRNGYSSDATPDIGFAAELVELAIRAAPPTSQAKFKGVVGRRYIKPAVQNAASW
jgi:hypothetical protein